MYDGLELSKYIVSKCIWDNCPITNLQLQRILYLVQRGFLQKRGCPAFDDSIKAWQFGPVIPCVYYYFCGFGAMPISHLYGKHEINPNGRDFVDNIVEAKRALPPWILCAETNKDAGAWDTVFQAGAGNRNVIPVSLIKTIG